MPPTDQLVLKERGNKLNKTMFYLINSKNNYVKKDFYLVYSQKNMTAYSTTIEGMARYLSIISTQYPNKNSAHQHSDKKGDTKKGDDPKSEEKNNNTGGIVGAHTGAPGIELNSSLRTIPRRNKTFDSILHRT